MNMPGAFGAYSNVVFNFIKYLCVSFLLWGKVQLLLNIFNYRVTARHFCLCGADPLRLIKLNAKTKNIRESLNLFKQLRNFWPPKSTGTG